MIARRSLPEAKISSRSPGASGASGEGQPGLASPCRLRRQPARLSVSSDTFSSSIQSEKSPSSSGGWPFAQHQLRDASLPHPGSAGAPGPCSGKVPGPPEIRGLRSRQRRSAAQGRPPSSSAQATRAIPRGIPHLFFRFLVMRASRPDKISEYYSAFAPVVFFPIIDIMGKEKSQRRITP